MHVLENERLVLKAGEMGAQLVSVFDKKTALERIWQGAEGMWPGKAPLLFPWCGRMFQGKISHGGRRFNAPMHGFARGSMFLPEKKDGRLEFVLEGRKTDREYYPYDFILKVEFSIDGARVVQRVRVENPGDETLPFGLGYHPGFALYGQDYVFRLEKAENPRLVLTPGGLVSGAEGILPASGGVLPVTDSLFAQDSLCMAGFESEYIELYSTGGGSGVRVRIKGFPYCLLWGPPASPVSFVCIEPWHTLPDPPYEYGDYASKQGVLKIAGGGIFESRLEMEFF